MTEVRSIEKFPHRSKTREPGKRTKKTENYLQSIADFIWYVPRKLIDLTLEESEEQSQSPSTEKNLKGKQKESERKVEEEGQRQCENTKSRRIVQRYKISEKQMKSIWKLQRRSLPVRWRGVLCSAFLLGHRRSQSGWRTLSRRDCGDEIPQTVRYGERWCFGPLTGSD